MSAARFLLDRAQERVAKRARGFLGGGPKGKVRVGSSRMRQRIERANARNYETVSAVTLGGDVVRVKVAKPNRIEGKRGANRLARLAHGLEQRKATGSFWHPRPRTGVYKRISSAERRKLAITRRIRNPSAGRSGRLAFHPDNEIGLNRPGARAIRRMLGPNYSAGRERRFERMFGVRKRDARVRKAFDDGRVIFKSEKADVTGKYVAGWFSVAEKDGDLVEDIQGDVIEMGDLRESAHEFVKMARVSKVMHDGEQIGDVVESVIIDDDFCKAHGITHTERGWWGAINVTDADAQERVRKGELPMFSIGGGGKREPFHKRGQRARSLRSLRARFGE